MFLRRRFTGHHKAPSWFGAHTSLYLMCAMMMFWCFSEGIVSFIVPLKISESGVSDTMLGLILGSSSVVGALFDLAACRLFKDTYYKRVFGLMLGLCFLFTFIFLQAHTAILFLVAMSIWGVYYDLKNIGSFDFVARTTETHDSSHSFGMLQVFQSVGWVLGPAIAGVFVGESVGWESFALILTFLTIATLCFILLCFSTGNRQSQAHKRKEKECRRGTWSEAKLMGKVSRALFPALVVIFILNFTDAFFWTIGPLFAEHIGLGDWAGLLLTFWSLPGLLLGWHAGKIAQKYGRERMAYVAQFLAGLSLIPIFAISLGWAILVTVFVAAFLSALAWPAIQGAFADYINQREDLEKEVAGLEDFYTNIAYVVGPILSGFLADNLGYGAAFSILGVISASAAALLVLFYPKRINLAKNGPPLICDV